MGQLKVWRSGVAPICLHDHVLIGFSETVWDEELLLLLLKCASVSPSCVDFVLILENSSRVCTLFSMPDSSTLA